ncbi:uncharacterized protein LOC142803144 [Rhipicephalus microplus]|uniref:uncharacterized protein LOC142803144 n=1 Tax=Rhipicephalus microplus TaxID=6941 RepID=UPI003F6C1DBA
MKYRAAPKRPSAAGGQPKDIQVRSGVTASAAARTTIRKCTQVYRRPSLASKVVEQQKTVPRSEAPKAGRKTLAPLTVAKPPTARPTPNLPEPRKPMGPPAKATTALKSLLPGTPNDKPMFPRVSRRSADECTRRLSAVTHVCCATG